MYVKNKICMTEKFAVLTRRFFNILDRDNVVVKIFDLKVYFL
jgi:hypothetical protein